MGIGHRGFINYVGLKEFNSPSIPWGIDNGGYQAKKGAATPWDGCQNSYPRDILQQDRDRWVLPTRFEAIHPKGGNEQQQTLFFALWIFGEMGYRPEQMGTDAPACLILEAKTRLAGS